MVNQELVSCLEATLNPDATIRHHAEYMLQQGSKQEGFAMGLLSISQAAQLPLGIRQLAAVLLRQHIKHHWSQDTVQEGKPCVTEAEKNQIRAMLPAGLADPNSRMQMAVGMAIAEITKWDDQSQWPQLLPGLVQAIHTKTNSHLGKPWVLQNEIPTPCKHASIGVPNAINFSQACTPNQSAIPSLSQYPGP